MQLTANLAILASAIAYSAPSVLALPIAGNTGSMLAARDIDYSEVDAREVASFDIDAREVDDLEFAARELINQYHEAREFYDELDARSYDNGQALDAREYADFELEAREFYNYLTARAGTSTTPDNQAFIKVHDDKKEAIKEITSDTHRATIQQIEKKVPSFKQIYDKLVEENRELQKETGVFQPTTHTNPSQSLTNKQNRVANLEIIKTGIMGWDAVQADSMRKFEEAVEAEKLYRKNYEREQAKKGSKNKRELGGFNVFARETHNVHLDPYLAKVLLDSSKINTAIYKYAQQENREFELTQQAVTKVQNSELKTLLNGKLAAQETHLQKLQSGDKAAQDQSKEYRKKLAAIENGTDSQAVERKTKKADRLQRILDNPNDKKDIDELIQELKAKYSVNGFVTTTSPTGPNSGSAGKQTKLRRRRL